MTKTCSQTFSEWRDTNGEFGNQLWRELDPEQEGGLKPGDLLRGTDTRPRWRCLVDPSHKRWHARIRDRTNRYGRCRDCWGRGFRSDEPAILYLIENRSLKVTKVGIMQEGSRRLEKFVKRGFEIIDVKEYDLGADAKQQETEILRHLRPLRPKSESFRTLVRCAIGGLGGETECVPSERVPQKTLQELIRLAS